MQNTLQKEGGLSLSSLKMIKAQWRPPENSQPVGKKQVQHEGRWGLAKIREAWKQLTSTEKHTSNPIKSR